MISIWRYTIFFVLFLILHGTIKAQFFKQNKGQWEKQVLFKGQFKQGAIFIEKNAITYNLYNYESFYGTHKHQLNGGLIKPLHFHGLQLQFVNAAKNTTIVSKQQSSAYFNYFVSKNREKWATHVPAFDEVVYKNLYKGIDYRIYAKQGLLEYDFIITPNADLSQISLQYKGTDSIYINKHGNLIVKTSVGNFTEEKPFAYQNINGKQKKIKCDFVFNEKEQTFSFKVGKYNPDYELIIDPVLIFCSYSGSTADNFGMTATPGIDGSFFAGGTTFNVGYPVTLGAYDVTFNGTPAYGITDIAITRYDSAGTNLIYSTYLGGTQAETVHSMIVNDSNELYLYGATGSADFPVTPNAFDTTFNGGKYLFFVYNGTKFNYGTDMYVAHLSADGSQLLNATYIGGSDNDGVNHTFDTVLVSGTTYMHPYDSLQHNYGDQYRGEIFLDKENNVYVASSTRSSDFPIINGFDNTLGGNQDGVILKLDSSLTTLKFSSYIGGSLEDAGYSVKVDTALNVYVAGGTVSNDFPVTAGTISGTFYGGEADGYIIKIDSSGQNILASTYIGSSQYDQCYFLDLDYFQNVYVIGQTTGSMPITPGTYNNPNSGIFIQKLQNDLSSVYYSTVVGNGSVNADFSPTAFLVDRCENVYFSGWGGNILTSNTLTGMPLSSNAFQTTTDGFNFYFMVLKRDATQLLYATYFGGNISREHVDGGTSRFDKNGIIYQSICAGCGGNSDLPTTTGAWSQTNNSSNCNNGTVKFDFEIVPKAKFTPSATSGCAPLTVNFANFASSGDGYFWDFGNGDTTSTEFNPVRTFTTPGTYNVMLIVTDSICGIKDTATKTITVYAPVTVDAGNNITTCDTILLTATTTGGANYFHWSSSLNFLDTLNNSLTDSTLSYFTQDSIMLFVYATNGFCSDTDSVFINTLFTPFTFNYQCGDSILLTANVQGTTSGLQYNWQPSTGIITGQGTNQVIVTPSSAQYFYLYLTNTNNCTYVDSIQVNTAVSVSTTTPVNTCDSALLSANVSGNYTTLIWSTFNNFSDTLNNNNNSSVYVNDTTGTFWYYVYASNGFCDDLDSVEVTYLPKTPFVLTAQCNGDTVYVEAQTFTPSDLTFYWQPDSLIFYYNQDSNIIGIIPDSSLMVYLTVVNQYGCAYTDSILVQSTGLSANDFSISAAEDTVLTGSTTTIQVTPAGLYTYAWTPIPDSSYIVEVTVEETTTYTVLVTDSNGCSYRKSITIYAVDVICEEPYIYIPNAFTPNGDGKNDVLYLRGEYIEELDLKIFDRWGELVFETNKQNKGWDGTYKGKLVEPAVFVYHLKVKCWGGEEFFKKGNITVVR